MSVYKVPQDVEAEDKIVGPFTLKQAIFIVVAIISGYLTYQLALVNPLLAIVTLPITLIAAVLGLYRRPDQPVEIYLLALMRFTLKPHKRIWDQDGVLEAVAITAPPKFERNYTDGLDQTQVRNQLQSLSKVMDTRGWSSKNSELQSPVQIIDSSDRLVRVNELPRIVQPTEVHNSDDILDVNNNVVAQNFNQMVQQMPGQIRENAQQQMQYATQRVQQQQANIPPMAQTPQNTPATIPYQPPSAFPSSQPVMTMPSGGQAFSPYPYNGQAPQTTQTPPATDQSQGISPMTAASSPDIIRLAQNSDLNLTTIAHQAEQALSDNEEISLR